jgi:hypothetical protein
MTEAPFGKPKGAFAYQREFEGSRAGCPHPAENVWFRILRRLEGKPPYMTFCKALSERELSAKLTEGECVTMKSA